MISSEKRDPQKLKEMWAGFIEFELEFKDLVSLNHFCFDFLPSSIEILNAEKLEVSRDELTLILNDMLTNMHKYQFNLNNLNMENEFLKQKLNSSQK